VVHLDGIRDSNRKQNMIDSVWKGAEDKSNNTTGIYFLNSLERSKEWTTIFKIFLKKVIS
jgi:hypothetical protein